MLRSDPKAAWQGDESCVLMYPVYLRADRSTPYPTKRGADSDIPTTGTLRRVSKSLEGSTAVQGGSCLFVSHRSVENSEIENYCSP